MKPYRLMRLFGLSGVLRAQRTNDPAANAEADRTADGDGDEFFMMLDGEPVTFNQFNERMARHFAKKPSKLRPDLSDVPFRADR
jgi:hypothetical protein